MNPRVSFEIEQFVSKYETNKDGEKYATVDEQDRIFLKQFLERFFQAFRFLFSDKKLGTRIFIDRLQKINAVRLDDADKGKMPMKLAYDSMLEHDGRIQGGMFMAMIRDGVVLICPDFMLNSKEEAIHTLIHEFVHAMSLITVNNNGKVDYQTGLHLKRDIVAKNINEGITELIAQILWSKMYPRITCPGIGRYGFQVECAKVLIEQFADEQQFIENYIINANRILEQLNNVIVGENQTLIEFLNGCLGMNLKDEKTQQIILEAIKNSKINLYEINNN